MGLLRIPCRPVSEHLQEVVFVLRLHDDDFVRSQNIADSHRARLVAFQAPLGDGLEGPLKGFGHALLLVDVQSRITDFIAVSVGGVPDEFRNERAAVHVAVA